MSEFKFKVGDEVQSTASGSPVQGTIRYCVNTREGRAFCYVVRRKDGSEDFWAENYLEPLPSAPLDANGQEIGIGDLVQWKESDHTGRVTGLGGKQILVKPLPGWGDPCGFEAAKFTILEKAPAPQIGLGSRVRVKATGDEFIVQYAWLPESGPVWAEHGGGSYYPEDELELIE